MNIVVLLLCLLINLFAYGEGFVSNTLVKTKHGHIKIENLKPQDFLISYDFANNKQVEQKILNVRKQKIPSFIRMVINGRTIEASPSQKIYIISLDKWVELKEIKDNPDIVFEDFNLTSIEEINEERDVYTLTVENTHNFCVTEYSIIVHNAFPAIAIGISIAFGEGSAMGSAVQFFVVVGGICIGTLLKNIFGKKNNNESIICYNQIPNPDPNDPDKDNKRKKNTITKTEFFKNVKNDYEHWRNGIYKRKPGAKGIENAEYLYWDHLHNDVEAYGKNERHLGSIDPHTLKLYKEAVYKRRLPE